MGSRELNKACMNKTQKAVLIGMVLGDAYLQKTGAKNARIRLEHSEKQKEYLLWKARMFPEYFQGKPKVYTRFNSVFGKSYRYIRWQSNASCEIGNMRRLFYINNKKTITQALIAHVFHPLSLSVWYMDDGYLYARDKMAYIYVPKLSEQELANIVTILQKNFGLHAHVKTKKNNTNVLTFTVGETEKLLAIVAPYIIPSMQYKLLDPVSTEH